MIRIIIADDHAIVRRGVRLILEEAGDMAVIAEAENGAQVLAQLRRETVDVLLLDIAMPGANGFEVLQRLQCEFPTVAVLILSMYPEEQYALRLLKAGAAGYLTKESAPNLLAQAVREVAAGRRFIGQRVAELLADRLSGGERDDALHLRLSDREYQVLCRIASGRTPTQIAEEMALSVRTVSTYRSRILAKMRMKTNAELTHYALKHDLIDSFQA
ncbi:MAG: response regulator transcription factor [Gammaproteobacteria bacterium]|nr:response regulator transcription factor [Gammaproteobacteria bacterium]